MSVVVAHPAPIIGAAICESLGPALGEVLPCFDAASLLAVAARPEVEVALVEETVADAEPGLCAQLDETEVAMVLLSSSHSGLADHLAAGVRGVVDTRDGIDGVIAAVTAVRAGHTHLPPQLLSAVLLELIVARRVQEAPAAPTRRDRPATVPSLSRREQEVLGLLVDGADHVGIAQALGIAPSTAKTHIARLLAKLNVRSRVEAVQLAVRDGLVPASRGESA